MHLIAPAPFGGAETVVGSLARQRGARGDTLVAALVSSANHPFVAGTRSVGTAIEPIVTHPRQYLTQVDRVAGLLRRHHVDVLHTHVYHANLVGYFAARRAGAVPVATFHGHTGGAPRVRLYEWLDRRILRRFDAVICVSERQRRDLAAGGIGDGRLHVIPNGAMAAAAVPRGEARRRLGLGDGPVVGWIGRFSEEKGPDLLLDAVTRIPREVTVVLMGDGPLRKSLEDRAAALRLDNVVFAGQRPDAGALMPALDLLVLSSRTEGMPMVLLEAIVAGVPVAAFAVGGIPDYLDAGSGWVVPPEDTVALAAAMTEAIAAPDRRAARAQAARRLLEGPLGPAHWLDRVEDVYRATVESAMHRN